MPNRRARRLEPWEGHRRVRRADLRLRATPPLPETLLLDSKGFRVHSGERAGRGFHVFAAMGAPAPAARSSPQVWRLEPFGRKDQAAWEEFLGACEGAPQVIVSDADTEHRICQWHLGRKLG